MQCAEKGCRRDTHHSIQILRKGDVLKTYHICPEARDRLQVGLEELLQGAPVRRRKKAKPAPAQASPPPAGA